ncbi:MAG: hypothetical protein VX278_08425 [Myxococcota bacterium]|nr:hypothetical protein [Myxococcota bacterium]
MRLHSVFLAFLSACIGDKSTDTSVKSDEIVLYNDCMLTEPIGEVPADLYTIQAPVATNAHGSFTKSMTVYGITLVGTEEVEDGFMVAVGQAIVEMFPADAADADAQADILRNMYQYKALIPVFAGGEAGFNPDLIETIPGEYSICDIIMSGVEGGQVMEVIEHILHIVSDVGLHYAYPEQWGMSKQSELYAAMQEAVSAGVYNTIDYQEIPEEGIRQRVLLQEFAYWIITSHWDVQQTYGPGDGFEWTATTPSSLQSEAPLSHTLIESTLANTMAAPDLLTLEIFEDYGG